MHPRIRIGSWSTLIALVAVALLTAFRVWLPGDLAAALGAVVLMLASLLVLTLPCLDLEQTPAELVAYLRPKVEILVPVVTAAQGLWVGFVAERLFVAGLIFLAAYACIMQWAHRDCELNWMPIFRSVTIVLTFGVGGAAIKFLLLASGTR